MILSLIFSLGVKYSEVILWQSPFFVLSAQYLPCAVFIMFRKGFISI